MGFMVQQITPKDGDSLTIILENGEKAKLSFTKDTIKINLRLESIKYKNEIKDSTSQTD